MLKREGNGKEFRWSISISPYSLHRHVSLILLVHSPPTEEHCHWGSAAKGKSVSLKATLTPPSLCPSPPQTPPPKPPPVSTPDYQHLCSCCFFKVSQKQQLWSSTSHPYLYFVSISSRQMLTLSQCFFSMDVTTALTLDPRQINSTDQFCKVQTEDVQTSVVFFFFEDKQCLCIAGANVVDVIWHWCRSRWGARHDRPWFHLKWLRCC